MAANFFGDYVLSRYQGDNITYSGESTIQAVAPVGDFWTPGGRQTLFDYLTRTGYAHQQADFFKGIGGGLSAGESFYSTASVADRPDSSLAEWGGLVAAFVPIVSQAIAVGASILGAIPAPVGLAEEAAALGIGDVAATSGASILGAIPAAAGVAEEVAALGGGIAADGSVIAAPLVATAASGAALMGAAASTVGAAASTLGAASALGTAQAAAGLAATGAALVKAGAGVASAGAAAAHPMAAFSAPMVSGVGALPTDAPTIAAGLAGAGGSLVPVLVVSGAALAAIYLVFMRKRGR